MPSFRGPPLDSPRFVIAITRTIIWGIKKHGGDGRDLMFRGREKMGWEILGNGNLFEESKGFEMGEAWIEIFLLENSCVGLGLGGLLQVIVALAMVCSIIKGIDEGRKDESVRRVWKFENWNVCLYRGILKWNHNWNGEQSLYWNRRLNRAI